MQTNSKERVLSFLLALILTLGVMTGSAVQANAAVGNISGWADWLRGGATVTLTSRSSFQTFQVNGVNRMSDWELRTSRSGTEFFGTTFGPYVSINVNSLEVPAAGSNFPQSVEITYGTRSGNYSNWVQLENTRLGANGQLTLQFNDPDEVFEFMVVEQPSRGTTITPTIYQVRLGDEDPGTTDPGTTDPDLDMELSSSGIRNGILLNEYGMHGTQFETVSGFQVPSRSMPLTISNPPSGARSYVIYMEDLDAPWVHWMAANIKTTNIPANASKSGAVSMVQGRNDFGSTGYGGPTPPDRDHRYEITVYALDVDSVSLSSGFSETAFWNAVQSHVIDVCSIEAVYRHSKSSDPDPDPEPTTPPIDPDEEYTLTLVAGAGGQISLGASGTYLGGDLVDIGATADEGYRFSNWTSTNGGTFGDARSATTTFTLPGGDTTITANFSKISTSGGKSSGGGGGGSSSGVSRRSTGAGTVPNFGRSSGSTTTSSATGAVSSQTILSDLNRAIGATDGSVVGVQVKNATSVGADTLRSMASAAAASGKTAYLFADTMSADGKAIQARFYVEPAKLTALENDLLLGVYTDSSKTGAVKAFFERYFSNNLAVVAFEQQGALGATLEVAVQVDLSDMNTQNLVFYSYDKATNQYNRLVNPNYVIDSSGYLHFHTNQGGSIIISDGALSAR